MTETIARADGGRRSGVVRVIAHRGASLEAPENTLAAFELAVGQGADRIELDLQATGDGALVVIHDATLERCTDVATRYPSRRPWDVRAFSAEEVAGLATLPTGACADAGGGVPTLERVLDAFAGRTSLLLELKDPARHPGVEHRLATMLSAHPDWLPDLAVQSFDPACLHRFHALLPEVRIGLLLERAPSQAELDALPVWVAEVNIDHEHADAAVVAAVRAAGRTVAVWTVNDDDRMRELIGLGVDGIITDAPGLLLDVLCERDGER